MHRLAAVAGARAALPLAVAVAAFGVTFGVLAREARFTPVAAVLMSLTTFAGGAQFAAASVLAQGGSVLAAVVGAVLLNSRYLPIGISVAQAFRGSWLSRLLSAQLVVDESWAVGHVDGRYDADRLIGAGAVILTGWASGTALGVLAGNTLGDPAALGLDAMAPALFLALLLPHVKRRATAVPAVVAAALAAALIPTTPAGTPVVTASVVALVALRRRP
jgi:4-azaleucine resistance transporter AzlC